MNSASDLSASIRRELIDIQPRKLAGEWPDTALFTTDLGLDSLDLVEFAARLEQSTGLFIPDEDLAELTCVATVVAYLDSRRVADG
jgi:acyl carrier protein